jgi:Lanthionine synthetase C-like protein
VTPERYRDLAEAATRWVLAQVRYDEVGPWIPESVTDPPAVRAPDYRDGMHSGIGGLGHLLAEVRRTRSWTDHEADLAAAVAERLRARTADLDDTTWFDGLVGDIGVLAALGEPGIEECVDRLVEVTDREWPLCNDATLGKAAVLVGALDALRAGVERARPLAERAVDVVLAEAEQTDAGLNWLFKPRHLVDEVVQMPNYSHGLAGIATALADGGAALGREDAVGAARRGAEHLKTLGDTSDGGFVVPRRIPPKEGDEVVTWNWCHGPAGTLALFESLGESAWVERCVRSLRTSGIPERRWPGFWDNDGLCCGTAGVGVAVLPHDLDLAVTLADACVERACTDGETAYWRFVEHRAEDPLLPPGVGWMQGAAGIAAFLFRLARCAE